MITGNGMRDRPDDGELSAADTPAAERPAADTPAADAILTAGELVVLQLLARGYLLEQIAALMRTTPAGIQLRLQGAVAALRADGPWHAIALARRRGLIT